MRVALVTCREMPDLWLDDLPLRDALRERGAEVATPVWDDPDVDWSGYDVSVVRSTWDYPGRRDEFLAWARGVPRLHNPYPVLAWNSHKGYLRDLRVPVVPTEWVPAGGSVDLAALLARRGWAEAVVKPAVSNGARDTQRFAAADVGAAQEVADRVLATRDLMVQPYLRAIATTGERSLLYVDGVFSHAVRRPAYLDEGRFADSRPADAAPDERAVADAALPPGLLYGRVDLVRDDAGRPVVMEVEVTEPQLFLRLHPPAATALADAVLRKVTESD